MRKEIIEQMIADWKRVLKQFIIDSNFNSATICRNNITKLEKEL